MYMQRPIKITILGCCRQESLYSDPNYHISCIHNKISYSHYSKEALEIIKYCKYGHIPENKTMEVFRTPILQQKPIQWTLFYKDELEKSDIIFIEIASKTAYQHENIHVHNIAANPGNPEYNILDKDNVIIRKQTYEEIENDIVEMMHELIGKKMIIVSHIYSYEHGERYELAKSLENICIKYSIPFLNPITEIKMLYPDIDIQTLFVNENVLKHYNEYGHNIIKKVYDKFINSLLH